MTELSDANESDSPHEWRRTSRYYLKPAGRAWLAGLLLIPLLFGWLATGPLNTKMGAGASHVGAPAPSSPGIPAPPPSNAGPRAVTVVRDGNDVTLGGPVGDLGVSISLLTAISDSFGPGINLTNQNSILPGAFWADFTGLTPLLKAAVDIPNFGMVVDGDTITLTGTAPSESVKAAVGRGSEIWRNRNFVNNIEVRLEVPLQPISITRNGNDITIKGDVANVPTLVQLMGRLNDDFGPKTNVINEMTVKPGVEELDFSELRPVFASAVHIPDFGLRLDGDTARLTGTAPSEDVKAAVADGLAKTWQPAVKIVNDITVKEPGQ